MHRPRHGANSNLSGEKAQLVLAYQELGNELHSTQLKVIGNYTLGRVIGEGSFGTVRLGIHRLTGSRVAIKHISKSSSPPLLTREIHHHRRLHHPHVVQLYEVIATEHSIWLITELCAGGELFDYLVEKTRFTESEARRLFGQICLGLGYVHSQGVVHRDLKLENVLLDERCNTKLADFGFGREFEPRKLLDTFCGTTGYAAPEMLAGKKYLGQEADIWSLGIILHALLTGSLPFDDDDEDTMKSMIMAGHFEIPNFISNEACNLVQSILQRDPKARPSIERILSHPWFTTPPLQHSFGDSDPLSRPSPILEEAHQFAKSPPLSIALPSSIETLDPVTSLKTSQSTPLTQTNTSSRLVLDPDSSRESHAASDNYSLLQKHSNTQSKFANIDNGVYNSTDSSQSTKLASQSVIASQKDHSSSIKEPNLPNFRAKAGSLKPLPLTALANLPSAVSHPQIRTPSRTKRRSVGSTLSERMGPFDEGTTSDLTPPTNQQSRLSASSLLTVVIDYLGALKATTQAPLLSREDLLFMKSLASLGFDSGQIVHSVQSYACDSSGALWWLLKKKLDQQLTNREDILSPSPSTNTPLNSSTLPSEQPSNVVSSSMEIPGLTLDTNVTSSYHKTSLVDTSHEDSPLVTLKLKKDSSTIVPKKPPSLAQPILSITESRDMDSSLNQTKSAIHEDRFYLNSRGDTTSSKNNSTLAATPANLIDDAHSSASSSKMETPTSSDKEIPHIIIDPIRLGKKSSPDLRKRSQSVSMLQRATHALVTKKSADDKHSKSRSREASSTHDGDEKYGLEKISKKDLKAREKESKVEENSKFSTNLPLSGLFSRKSLLHPLPSLPVNLMSQQTPPGSDRSIERNTQKFKENDLSVDNSLSSSIPSTPKGIRSRVASRDSIDIDLNTPGEDQTHSSAPSLQGSSSFSPTAPSNLALNHLDPFCTPKPLLSLGRATVVPPNSRTEDLKESSPAISSLSDLASSHKPSPSESEIVQGNRSKSAKSNLFSNFKFWFNEDRRKRKKNMNMITSYGHAGTSRIDRTVESPGATSPPVSSNYDTADIQMRKALSDLQTGRKALGPVMVHRRPSKGSRRSSIQSNRQVSLELRNNSGSKRRSDSSRASLSSITGTRTPASEPSSHISGSQSTINPGRGSSDGHTRNRRPDNSGRRTSMSSAGSRRSTAPLHHLAPHQTPIINPSFVRRKSSTGTSVRRITAPIGSTSNSHRPRPSKTPSFTSSIRTSISSDEGIQLLSRRTSGGGSDEHRIHSPIVVHDVEETIEEEDEKESVKSLITDRESKLKTDDARRNAFQKLSGSDKEIINQPESSFEDVTSNQSHNPTSTATRAIFMAHKPHSVFGTPTQAFFARSTQSPIATKFNIASSTSNVTSYSNLMKSIADGPSSRKSSQEPKLRDVFANKAKEDGEWVDVDDENDECLRYAGGIGQGVQSRSDRASGLDRTGGKNIPTTGTSLNKLSSNSNHQISSSSMQNSGVIKSNSMNLSSSLSLPSQPLNSSFKSVSDSINPPPGPGNSPAASLIGNWRGGNPRVTSNFKSIAIEEEEEED